jgi:hypothetical protein
MNYLQVVQDFVRTPSGSVFNAIQHPRRFHLKAASGHGCITALLLWSVAIGGITIRIDFASQWIWFYNGDRSSMALGGFTLEQHLAMAV